MTAQISRPLSARQASMAEKQGASQPCRSLPKGQRKQSGDGTLTVSIRRGRKTSP